jgi:hypothetical protein
MRIHPFAQSEIEGTKPDLISRALLHADAVVSGKKINLRRKPANRISTA